MSEISDRLSRLLQRARDCDAVSNESYVSEIIGELEAIAALSADGGATEPLGYLRAFDAQYLERKISGQCQVIVHQTPPRKNATPIYTHPAAAATGEGWRAPATIPGPSTDGETLGLALYVETPDDGGPNVRQGRYDHCLSCYIDSTTAMRIEPDAWTFIPAAQQEPAPYQEEEQVCDCGHPEEEWSRRQHSADCGLHNTAED